jgi:hypothetical protein
MGDLKKAFDAEAAAGQDLADAWARGAPKREIRQLEIDAEEASNKVALEFGRYDPTNADAADVDVARRLDERDSGSPAKPVIQVPKQGSLPDHVPGAKKS